MHHLIELDPTRKLARVQPGLIYDDLNRAAAKHQLAFGPDPSTHSHCTIGGMIGNNSCGLHSVMASFAGTGARTSDNLHLIRERYPKIPRRVSGYNLDDLLPEKGFHVARALTGSEGTCVTVLEATVHLVYSPPIRALVALGYPDVYTVADHVPEILQFRPVGLEGIDELLIDGMKKKKMHPEDFELLPPGAGWLLVEFGGETKEEADAHAVRSLLCYACTGTNSLP